MEYNDVLFEIVLSMLAKRDVYTTQAADELLEIATYTAGMLMSEFEESEEDIATNNALLETPAVVEPVASVEQAVEAVDEAEGVETAIEEKIASEIPVEGAETEEDPLGDYLLESSTEAAPMAPAADMTVAAPAEVAAPETLESGVLADSPVEAPAPEAVAPVEAPAEVAPVEAPAEAPVSEAAPVEAPVGADMVAPSILQGPRQTPVEAIQAEPATDSVEPAQ